MHTIISVVGARPNFMKAAPVSHVFGKTEGIRHLLLHTGQHYDPNMSDVFFEDLGLGQPDIYLGVGSGSHATQTATIMTGFETVCLEHKPSMVIVYGDVNSTLAAAIVARKLGISVAHVEAGLRSFDRRMPEEINRIVTDSITDFFFVTEESGRRNLLMEGHPPERVCLVGNTMIDSLARLVDKLGKAPDRGEHIVLTLHRPGNVDNAENLGALLQAIEDGASGVPVIFPVHPRTEAMLRATGRYQPLMDSGAWRILPPAGYREFIEYVRSARGVITDSGGIQEETTWLGIPCLTLRESTERPSTVELGTNVLVGIDHGQIRRAIPAMLAETSSNGALPERSRRVPPMWDGRAAERIVRHVIQFLSILLLLTTSVPLIAQPIGDGNGVGGASAMIKALEEQRTSTEPDKEIGALEAPINPATYRVGPNDQFLLSMPSQLAQYPVRIGPDNLLILPLGVPAVEVGGMTLSELRAKIEAIYRARSASYRNVALSLVVPRRVRIRVHGDVLVEGPMVLTSADRVSTAIDAANVPSEDMTPRERTALLEASRRRLVRGTGGGRGGVANVPRSVTLRHNDGTYENVDLLRWRALGDESSNPTLREGDEIIVPEAETTLPTVSIGGAVRSPATVAWRNGDNALLLVSIGAGVRADGDPSRALLYRATSSGLEAITVDLSDTAKLASIIIEPGDRLVVPVRSTAVTGGGRTGAVAVEGQVVAPGTYAIVPGITLLSDVVQQAGGPTSNASLNGAYIERIPIVGREIVFSPREDPSSHLATSSLTLDDTTRLARDLSMQEGRVSADFESIIAHNDRSRDVVLQDGDRIVIPVTPSSVEVLGRVNYPGAVNYVAGADLLYYIDRAGGYTDAADPDRVEVIKYGTNIWASATDRAIMPGDRVYVPGDRDTPARTNLEIAGTIIGITAAITSIASAIFYIIRESQK